MNGLNAAETVLDGTGLQGSVRSQGGNEFMMVYVSEAKAQGEFQVITFDGDEETNPKLADAATLAVYQKVGVLLEAVTTAGFYEVQTKGVCEALVDGTTDVAKDDFLEVLNTSVSAVKDGTTRSVNSVAIAREAQTTNAGTLTDVYLLGERVIIAAS
jgi:hypothetical protein